MTKSCNDSDDAGCAIVMVTSRRAAVLHKRLAGCRFAGDLPAGDLPAGDLPAGDLPAGQLLAGTCLRDACPDCVNFSCWNGRVLSAKLRAILGHWRRGARGLASFTTRGRFVLPPASWLSFVLAKPRPIQATASQRRRLRSLCRSPLAVAPKMIQCWMTKRL
jgi:hypothetical protein